MYLTMRKIIRYFVFSSFILTLLSGCKKDDPVIEYGSITDIEGNIYKTISIGTQTWMAENLRTIHYSNGDPVQNISDDLQWTEQTTGAFCWYNNDESLFKDTYGALYNYYTVTDYRKICPSGWRIPTKADCEKLGSFLGGDKIAGEKLKEAGTALWYSPNEECANDKSGFSARGGGSRNAGGAFEYIRQLAVFWTSSSARSTDAYFYFLVFETSGFYTSPADKKYGCSVRCIKEGDKK
jgi:uncharacterized protein (TIGR02145 family)